MPFQNKKRKKDGLILTSTLVFGIIGISLVVALTSWFGVVYKSSRDLIYREQAFYIAEAGIEYYKSRLIQNPDDYYDGQGQSATGPFVHDFKNLDGETIGQFSLNITAPTASSNFITIESTGSLNNAPSISRTIKVQMAKPSFIKFAFVSDSNMRFGVGTEVFGPIHSNGGIRFDGVAHNIVSSALY